MGKEKFCSREVTHAADGSMRVGPSAYIKGLHFVPPGKLREEQSGDANEVEKNAMRSMLGALRYLARESRPDLSGPVSIRPMQPDDVQRTVAHIVLSRNT